MKKIYLTPFIIFAVLILFFIKSLFLKPNEIPSSQIGKALPKLAIASLTEEKFYILDETSSNQKWFLINIWASWCASCLDEHHFLLSLAKNNVDIFGLDYKDSRTAAKQWLHEWGNPYKFNGFDQQGKIAFELGVYGTPETFLIDNAGKIRYRYAGILNESVWQKYFIPLIKKIEAEN